MAQLTYSYLSYYVCNESSYKDLSFKKKRKLVLINMHGENNIKYISECIES
jgi:hypothetical protein